MKKLFFAFMTVALVASASSCKKCGYCKYSGNQGNSNSVCNNNTFAALGVDEYKEAQSQCQADNGVWVTTK